MTRRTSKTPTVTLERAALTSIILRDMSIANAVERGLVSVEGNPAKVAELFNLFDDFSMLFEVVEPKRQA